MSSLYEIYKPLYIKVYYHVPLPALTTDLIAVVKSNGTNTTVLIVLSHAMTMHKSTAPYTVNCDMCLAIFFYKCIHLAKCAFTRFIDGSVCSIFCNSGLINKRVM